MTQNKPLLNWVLASQFAAILVIFSKLTIPLGPIPLTGQTLAVGLIASLLTPVAGNLAILLYLLLGLIGLPVFAGSATSFAVIFGPTGGYLWGFIAYVSFTSWWLQRRRKSPLNLTVANFIGAMLQLAMGSVWLIISNHLSVSAAFLTGFYPFLLPAIFKIVMVVALARIVNQRLTLPLGQRD